jgi:protein-arginine kinase activator protein McsA
MTDLRRELARAVAAEAYERAALLRDRIRALDE